MKYVPELGQVVIEFPTMFSNDSMLLLQMEFFGNINSMGLGFFRSSYIGMFV